MRINWLEPSEEDPLVYTVGNEDNNNPPQCFLDIATVVLDGEKFTLISPNEEQRLKNLANASDKNDYKSSGEKERDGDNHEDDDDQPTLFEAGRSRSAEE